MITPESEQTLPIPDMPALRARMNDALLDLVYADPLDAWGEVPLLELDGPLENRLPAVLTALGQPL